MMDAGKRRNAVPAWAAIGLVAALCGVLAVLQYRWLGEISGAERQNLQAELRDRLEALRRDLNEQVSTAERVLQPASYQVEEMGREAAYAAQYLHWKQHTSFGSSASRSPCPQENGSPAFIVRLPAMTPQRQDELAPSVS